MLGIMTLIIFPLGIETEEEVKAPVVVREAMKFGSVYEVLILLS